jgi:hypothetical protein
MRGALLNRLARTWQLLRSLSPHSTASKIVAVKRSRFKVALETQAKVNSCDCCNILAEKIVIGDEEPAQFESLRAELEAHYAPRTRMQRELIDYIAGLFWRLERLPALEAALIDVLRNKVAPDEIDSEAEQARREEFEKITAKLLRKFWLSCAERAQKRREGAQLNSFEKTRAIEHGGRFGFDPGQSRAGRAREIISARDRLDEGA